VENYRPHPDVVFTQLDDVEAVLLHLVTKKYFSLNQTGIRIWQMLSEQVPVDEIIRRIVDEFDVDTDGARSSVTRFLGALFTEGLIVN